MSNLSLADLSSFAWQIHARGVKREREQQLEAANTIMSEQNVALAKAHSVLSKIAREQGLISLELLKEVNGAMDLIEGKP